MICETAVRRACVDAARKAGIAKKVGCHDLRHSCAALLLAAGVPATRAAAVLRHTNTRTLLIVYAGLVESGDRSSSQSIDDLIYGTKD